LKGCCGKPNASKQKNLKIVLRCSISSRFLVFNCECVRIYNSLLLVALSRLTRRKATRLLTKANIIGNPQTGNVRSPPQQLTDEHNPLRPSTVSACNRYPLARLLGERSTDLHIPHTSAPIALAEPFTTNNLFKTARMAAPNQPTDGRAPRWRDV
jgi:hypothetical protein